MKKTLLLCSMFIPISFMSVIAHAEEHYIPPTKGIYVDANIGYGRMNLKNAYPAKNHVNMNITKGEIGLGYDLYSHTGYPVRVAIDYTEASHNFDSSEVVRDTVHHKNRTLYFDHKLKTSIVFANAYYDIKYFDNVTPFVFAGLGFSNKEYSYTNKITSKSESYSNKADIAYDVGAGVSLKLSENISAQAALKYIDNGNIDANLHKVRVNEEDFLAGLRYTF